MKRALSIAIGIALAVACAEQTHVRRASDASAEAMKSHGVDAGVPASAKLAVDGGTTPAPVAAAPERTPAEPSKPTPTPTPTSTPTATPPPTPTATPTAVARAPEPARPQPTVTKSGAITLLALPATPGAIVNVQLNFRSGAIDDPPGKAGLTYLTARVMTEGGTQALDSKALLNALFPLAAELSVRVDKEETTFIARVHKDNLAKFLPILTDVVLHPRWDPAEFKRLRESAVNDVEKRLRQGDDENLGKSALDELMYRNHPYGRLTLGHVSDLKTLALADLQQQAQKVFTADRLTVGISGGYPENLGQQLAQTLSSLPGKSEQPQSIPHAQPHAPRYLLVEKNADSTAVSMGLPWKLSHKDPDWAALSVAKTIMGEHRQSSGRLFQRLREMRGLNYGDYAYLEHFEQESFDAATMQNGRARRQQDFTVWLRPIRNDNRLFAVRGALYELARSLKEDPFTQAEVDQTKGFLDGYILLFDQTDARRLGYALDDNFYGMSNFLGAWRSQLKDVTADQVNAAWRKWVDPSKLEIVVAGKDMASVKKAILSGEPTPIEYQRDASGKAPDKDADQLATDKQMAAFPFGAQGDADVQVVQVEDLFQ